jgi:hypothetical protein
MSQVVIENPIINSPFDEPTRHFRFTDDGITDEIIDSRRTSSYFVPIAKPKKKGSKQLLFDTEWTQDRIEPNKLVNDIRRRVALWRQGGYVGVTPTTARLIAYWTDPTRERKLFFCQNEALETAIYIAEVAKKYSDAWIENAIREANDTSNPGLPRMAFKMATGSGKTVVMAMLIAWHTLNKRANPQDARFSDTFLIVTPGITIRDRLRDVLTDNLNEFDDDTIARMIIFNFERKGKPVADEAGIARYRSVLGFTLELPDETTSARAVVDEFASALTDDPIEHVVKFEDDLLREELAQRWSELFALEMKLRRVLSLIYLHAYQEGDPYDLLCDEAVKLTANERPNPDQMKKVAENQFFHFLFSQYVSLNQRPEPRLPTLLEIIRAAENYESLRAEMMRAPVADEDDAVLLAGLKERVNVIEAMRNCVAHSRHPNQRVMENYENARPLLDQLLNDYLARWALVLREESNFAEEG